jgi:starvation-inducible DNA-binding protein
MSANSTTFIAMPPTRREGALAVVKQLTTVLADTYNLAVKTHGAHWNVRGSGFYRLHQAFDEQYHALLEAADALAERIRALDCNAPGSMRQLLALSSLGEPPESADHLLVAALRNDHRQLSATCSGALETAKQANDDVTADMLIARIEQHDKTAWMLTATLGT